MLVVDDEPSVRALIAATLQAQGYTVLEADDGQEALAIARAYAGAIHLTISDVHMPGLSADAFAAQLRADRPAVRMLFVSGYTGDWEPPVEGARTEFLAKPFLPTALAAKVREVLDCR